MKALVLAIAALALANGSPACSQETPGPEPVFITLGTGGGPIPDAARAQPAHLLRIGDKAILIDVGDGATSQLGRAGVPLEQVKALFVSHLHFDHAGGLFALISRRYQMLVPGMLAIYGPPGTKDMVASLLDAMRPALAAWSSLRAGTPLESTVSITELADGWSGTVEGVQVTAASNSHYVALPDSAAADRDHTYSFRFDTGGRSLAYTGDTGPSESVEKLAADADILFAEIMDPDLALADLKATRPDIPAAALAVVSDHYRREHLSPEAVGEMARDAHVKSLVLVHNPLAPSDEAGASQRIATQYKGPITFAHDLDKF